MKLRKRWQSMKSGYARFVEKQGFSIIVTVCIAVITGTAMWTRKQDAPLPSPTPPALGDVAAARLIQQTMTERSTPSPTPTATPQAYHFPLASQEVLRPYAADQMVRSGVSGVYRLHDAVDLAADDGSSVTAIADGRVIATGHDALWGTWITIDHGAFEARYAGMMSLHDYQAGDSVRMGDAMGAVGSIRVEADLPPHLHLQTWRDGASFDPMTLFP